MARLETARRNVLLLGRLNLNRVALDQAVAAEEISRAARVLAVAIDTTRLNVGFAVGAGARAGSAGMPRARWWT